MSFRDRDEVGRGVVDYVNALVELDPKTEDE